MSELLHTSGAAEGTEGNDKLREFFEMNDKLQILWYDKLAEQGIDYDELMESDPHDIELCLKNECKFDNRTVRRIKNAIRKIPQSSLYKESTTTKVSIVSTEEHQSSEAIRNESSRITEAIDNIGNIMKNLSANSQKCETIINDTFNNIIIIANKRKEELLSNLKHITNTKNNQLLDQQNALTEKIKILNEAYNNTQNMMKDTTIDIHKRKTKILSTSQQVLGKELVKVNPVTNDKINLFLDINKLNDLLSKIGAISDGNGPLPPTVSVTDIKYNSAKIVLMLNEDEKECIGHKIEYAKNISNYDNKEEEKLEWISKDLSKDLLLIITSLSKDTKYIVRGASKSKNGFGMYSQLVTFKTKNIDPRSIIIAQMIFDRNMDFDTSRLKVENDLEITAHGSNAYNTCIKFKFGIPAKGAANQYNIKSVSWTVNISGNHWPHSHGGIFYGVVSNKATNFKIKGAYTGLQDCYGLSASKSKVFKGNPSGKTNYCCDNADGTIGPISKSDLITITCNIGESKLVFYNKTQNKPIYTMGLPNRNDITNWYPAFCIGNEDCRCVVSDVNVQF